MYHYDLFLAAPNSAIDSYYDLPSFRIGEVNKAIRAFHTAGGKGFNAARALKNLGGRPFCTGIVAGSSGQFIAAELDREGIAHDLVWCEGETRRCNTIYFPGQADTTVILENGFNIGEEIASIFTQRILDNFHTAPFTALAGSLPMGFPPGFYGDTIARLKAHNTRVCIDSSGEPLRLAAQSGPWMIKVNRKEFDSVFLNGEATNDWANAVQKVYQELCKLGLEILVITAGEDGAYVFSGASMNYVHTPIQRVESSAGSGDTFLSALLFGLVRGEPLDQAAALASAAAAANVLQLGCGFFERETVDALLKSTQIKTYPLR